MDEGGIGILPEEDPTKGGDDNGEAKQATETVADAPPAAEAPAVPDVEIPDSWADEEDEFAPVTEILTLKTQVGQERRVAEMLTAKARKFGLPIFSLLAPTELRGYVFVETDDPMKLEKGVRGVSYARSFIKGPDGQVIPVPFEEISHFLQPVSAVAKIAEGDIVELVSGPFRGEKAKVTRVDDAREEITVELVESMVPIPITVKGEHVRVLKRGDDDA